MDLIERTGVDSCNQDPYDLLYQRIGFSTKGVAGYDLKPVAGGSGIRVQCNCRRRTGDNLRLGRGRPQLLMNPNGIFLFRADMKSNGHYELNLFGLVNRRFELAKGVQWSGTVILWMPTWV